MQENMDQKKLRIWTLFYALGIGMLKKLSNYLPRHSLVTLYKVFIRPHLDYGAIIYDKPNYCLCQMSVSEEGIDNIFYINFVFN